MVTSGTENLRQGYEGRGDKSRVQWGAVQSCLHVGVPGEGQRVAALSLPWRSCKYFSIYPIWPSNKFLQLGKGKAMEAETAALKSTQNLRAQKWLNLSVATGDGDHFSFPPRRDKHTWRKSIASVLIFIKQTVGPLISLRAKMLKLFVRWVSRYER